MIKYTLKCENNHSFEAWFQSGTACAEQIAAGDVLCPFCETANVGKALMAPRLARSSSPKHGGAADYIPDAAARQDGKQEVLQKVDDVARQLPAQAQEFVQKIRQVVEKNCDYVGHKFAEEARKIHYGEADERGIYGEASGEDIEALLEEGIDFMPLPWKDQKLDS
jgi:hypothetical protein